MCKIEEQLSSRVACNILLVCLQDIAVGEGYSDETSKNYKNIDFLQRCENSYLSQSNYVFEEYTRKRCKRRNTFYCFTCLQCLRIIRHESIGITLWLIVTNFTSIAYTCKI